MRRSTLLLRATRLLVLLLGLLWGLLRRGRVATIAPTISRLLLGTVPTALLWVTLRLLGLLRRTGLIPVVTVRVLPPLLLTALV